MHNNSPNIRRNRFAQFLAVSQVIYFFTTALWPIVHIDSFMNVTGPKTDTWLVQTVAAILLAITTYLIWLIVSNSPIIYFAYLTIAVAIALTTIDIYFVFNDTISPIYLADAAAEIILVILWVFILRNTRSA